MFQEMENLGAEANITYSSSQKLITNGFARQVLLIVLPIHLTQTINLFFIEFPVLKLIYCLY